MIGALMPFAGGVGSSSRRNVPDGSRLLDRDLSEAEAAVDGERLGSKYGIISDEGS